MTCRFGKKLENWKDVLNGFRYSSPFTKFLVGLFLSFESWPAGWQVRRSRLTQAIPRGSRENFEFLCFVSSTFKKYLLSQDPCSWMEQVRNLAKRPRRYGPRRFSYIFFHSSTDREKERETERGERRERVKRDATANFLSGSA